MNDIIINLADKFIQKKTLENYLNLRDAIANSPDYAPYTDYSTEAFQLIEQGKNEEAKEYLLSLMPNWLLNPGIHALLCNVYKNLGMNKEEEGEYVLYFSFLDGILLTGDGSEKKPYLVLDITDEYDILEYLEKELEEQELIQNDEKSYDLIKCTDGTEIWFDVTTPYSELAKKKYYNN